MDLPLTTDGLLQFYRVDPKQSLSLKTDEGVAKNYLTKRHILFSRFDEGIQLTFEAWYSVCSEYFAGVIADVISTHVQGDGLILDLFGGAGGQAIGLALKGHTVHSLEYNERHCMLIRQNSRVYGVEHLIFPVCCDVFTQSWRFCCSGGTVKKYDCAILSPPWGGPGYWRCKDINLLTMEIARYKGSQLVTLMCKLVDMGVTNRFILHLPRNTTEESIAAAGARVIRRIVSQHKRMNISREMRQRQQGTVIITEMHLNGRVNFLAVYIGCWDRNSVEACDKTSIKFVALNGHSNTILGVQPG